MRTSRVQIRACKLTSRRLPAGDQRVDKHPPHEFAHLIRSKIQFSKVARNPATSIVLMIVLLAGIITPSGLCAIICKGHSLRESQAHCNQPSDTMPGMVHHHSGMNHSRITATSPLLVSQSCQPNCIVAERLAISRKALSQVTVVTISIVELNDKSKLLVSDLAAAWILDSGPPSPPSSRATSFSILRI